MPNSAKFVIGGEAFGTKKEVTRRIRQIKDEAPLGQLEGADRKFCLAFFALHPNVKKALNLEEVFVSRHPRGHRQFEVLLTDGRMLDISYQKPLRTLTGLDSHKADVLLAMRWAVHPQILGFKENQDTSAFDENYVVDHKWPNTFDALVKQFLKEEDASFDDVKLLDDHKRLGRRLTSYWHKGWTEFHKEHAVLRLADRQDNSRWGNRDPEHCGDKAS